MEEAKQRSATLWVRVISTVTAVPPSFSRMAVISHTFVLLSSDYPISSCAPSWDLEKLITVSSMFGALSSQKRERGKESLASEVSRIGSERGRKKEKQEGEGGWHGPSVSPGCSLTSYLSSGLSCSSLLETMFLTHFSLGFLLFMMKSFVKETKIENKIYTKEENVSTNPRSYFKCEVHTLRRVLLAKLGGWSGQRLAVCMWAELLSLVLITIVWWVEPDGHESKAHSWPETAQQWNPGRLRPTRIFDHVTQEVDSNNLCAMEGCKKCENYFLSVCKPE